MTKKVVNPKFAKSENYQKVLKRIEGTNKCPFCKRNFKYQRPALKILKREEGWSVIKNNWPYKNSKHHFAIISKEHKEEFNELNSADFEIVFKLANWLIKKYKIKGGCFILRFGDPVYTGATVCHLHFHLIVPKIDRKKKKAKAVYFPIG